MELEGTSQMINEDPLELKNVTTSFIGSNVNNNNE